jgi:hypothetical protein
LKDSLRITNQKSLCIKTFIVVKHLEHIRD